jgi:hypothetical protein
MEVMVKQVETNSEMYAYDVYFVQASSSKVLWDNKVV